KSGSSCTHRRYFSTAPSRSPTARSPLASSKICSIIFCGIPPRPSSHPRIIAIPITRTTTRTTTILSQRRRWRRQKSPRYFFVALVLVLFPALDPSSADDADNDHEDDLNSASQPCADASLSFLRFQSCCLLAVVQPFDKNNALLVLKNSLFK